MKEKARAIEHLNTTGPRFGGNNGCSADLWLDNKSNVNTTSYANIGSAYSHSNYIKGDK